MLNKTMERAIAGKTCKPVIKWAGGKDKLKLLILQSFPDNYGTYYEPFLGGGAIAFSLPCGKNKVLSDINKDLIGFYRVLRDDLESLTDKLTAVEKSYQDPRFDGRHFFAKIRDVDRIPNWRSRTTESDRAARFAYLNKAGFNGLWRVNSDGQNNNAYGDIDGQIKRLKFDFEAYRSLSLYLGSESNKILNLPYWEALTTAQRGDLVYLDPPYDAPKGKSKVTYTGETFDQTKLKRYVDGLTDRGVKIVLSNANTTLVQSLYKSYGIQEIDAPRAIACNGDRAMAKELIITNSGLL